MFFIIPLQKCITVHPRYFGPKLDSAIRQILISDVEGQCMGRYGFVMAITKIEEVGGGKIQPGRGFVQFDVKYKALVFRPFKGEVVDAVVTQVTKVGIFGKIGPLNCYVSCKSMPSDMEFDSHSNPPRFRSRDEGMYICAEDEMRMRIIGYRISTSDFFAVGSLIGEALGKIN